MISPLFSHPNLNCAVEEVHFVDGTQWTAPRSADTSVAAAQEAPPPEALHILGNGYVGTELEAHTDGTIVVRLVLPGGAADIGGLKQNDVIEQIDGQAPTSIQDVSDLITSARPGTRLSFTVSRDGEAVVLHVTTARRPPDAPTDGPL